ncbi:MAG: AAA family ATPase [Spirulina sp. SIO3F2]|nr:AAA family ATPase [Spirulina sp. SIO3F2]
MKEELSILIQAQYPLIYLVTPEEDRAQQVIANLAHDHDAPKQLFVWTVTQGMVEHGQPRTAHQHNTISPEAAVRWTTQRAEPAIYLFKDLHDFIADASVKRALRDAIAAFKGSDRTLILMSPVQDIPLELEKDAVLLDFAPPTAPELAKVLDKQLNATGQIQQLSPIGKEKLVQAALGLTEDEAEKVYRKAFVKAQQLTPHEVGIIHSEKKQIIRRNGILEYIEEDETMSAIGGLEELKAWLKQRSDAFSERARDYGLPLPKGVLLLGVPGCGKTRVARTTSREWGLPCLHLSVGKVYDGSMVGRSEANLRNALKVAESIAPVVLFIDEIEKGFAGGVSSGDSDGGTSGRIMGSFLTWMQEKQSAVFVIATANRIDSLPGEFLRKGRFDEIFFVDLPTPAEREEIFRIHLQKRRPELIHLQEIEEDEIRQEYQDSKTLTDFDSILVDKRSPKVERFQLDQLAKASDGFSGAEIEQAIIAAMYKAFAQNREFTQLDIIAALKATLPLSKTMPEQVNALRDWAGQRARPAAASTAEYHRLEF